jgi:uncharacterized protein related to proFAR isomerase
MVKYISNLNDLSLIKDRHDIASFLNKMGAEKVCEVGVKDGANFNTLLVQSVKIAVAIDIWTETGVNSQNDDRCIQQELDRQYMRLVNLSKRDSRVQVIKDFSLDVCSQFKDNYFDFVYIDADHTESAVYADLLAWYSKVRPGGVLAGHDYCECTLGCGVKFGVIPAVNKFVKENSLSLHVDNELPWHDWFIPKPN